MRGSLRGRICQTAPAPCIFRRGTQSAWSGFRGRAVAASSPKRPGDRPGPVFLERPGLAASRGLGKRPKHRKPKTSPECKEPGSFHSYRTHELVCRKIDHAAGSRCWRGEQAHRGCRWRARAALKGSPKNCHYRRIRADKRAHQEKPDTKRRWQVTLLAARAALVPGARDQLCVVVRPGERAEFRSTRGKARSCRQTR